MSIELGLTADARWTISPQALAASAGEAGFSAIGLWMPMAEVAQRAPLGHGVRCSELMALFLTGNERKTLEIATRLATAVDTTGAEWVLTGPLTPPTDDCLALLARCAGLLAEAGARLAIEFSPFSQATSICDAVQWAKAAGHRAAVLVDTWHFFRGPSTWEQLEQMPLDEIAYIQFDDAPPPITDDGFRETMTRRVFPGQGTFALERFADTLHRRGWTGTVSVEVLNDGLAGLPVREFANEAYRSAARYWL